MTNPAPLHPVDPERDLTISRLIRAPRASVWRAWADPRRLEQWWLPAPATCRVEELELWPGGAFETRMSDDGREFGPHISGCILVAEPEERLVFTNALTGGWRPAQGFMTAVMTFEAVPEGTIYSARVLHGTRVDRDLHAEAGFAEGWGTVLGQLAEQLEGRTD
ncbi:SRPBCC domain-containing protein [Herbiconiux moechotypicola]|uniref:SRPBCC family protein n=1 Tax=Herbiconiux moechotypicola TaxID=637393 RepID=A0ABN3DNX5_9MICO|nr:SRPBCC domain-containing protein [Herbiconiux moechotypicola]MCS5730392.1 SRPBCC domain-containing protein [Herbiconiux moechotypicola]